MQQFSIHTKIIFSLIVEYVFDRIAYLNNKNIFGKYSTF